MADTYVLHLTPENIKALEQTRQRLSQLTHSLASLENLLKSGALPPWTSLQSHAAIISQNLNTVSTHYTTHSHLFSSLAVYPYPSFPGKTQEPLLGQILRKKLEPEVQDWVSAGVEECMPTAAAASEVNRFEAQMELWNWAGRAANELARKHEWGGDFTLAEREAGVENVVTGLKRKLIDSDSEDGSLESDEDDVKMEDNPLWGEDDRKEKLNVKDEQP